MTRIYPKNSEMAKQMEDIFKVSTLITKLNNLPEEDREIIRGRIINSILFNTCKSKAEIIATLDNWKHEWLHSKSLNQTLK